MTQRELKDILHYDPDTGVFRWRISPRYGIKPGDEAGYIQADGYRKIVIGRKWYQAHRLVFLYMEGYLPENQVDHINRNRADNRWRNLREAAQVCQSQNRSLNKNNSSGYKGVSFHKKTGKWSAYIKLDYKHKYLGLFTSAVEAAIRRLCYEYECKDWHCDEGWYQRFQDTFDDYLDYLVIA